MGFNGFFSLLCQIPSEFWWVPIMVLREKKHEEEKKYEEHSDRASNKNFVGVQI